MTRCIHSTSRTGKVCSFYARSTDLNSIGLPRSTTWSILSGNHKKSGLSATLVTRTLKSPRLPPAVRAKIIEYIEAKAAGGLGHNKLQQRRFVARLKRGRP